MLTTERKGTKKYLYRTRCCTIANEELSLVLNGWGHCLNAHKSIARRRRYRIFISEATWLLLLDVSTRKVTWKLNSEFLLRPFFFLYHCDDRHSGLLMKLVKYTFLCLSVFWMQHYLTTQLLIVCKRTYNLNKAYALLNPRRSACVSTMPILNTFLHHANQNTNKSAA